MAEENVKDDFDSDDDFLEDAEDIEVEIDETEEEPLEVAESVDETEEEPTEEVVEETEEEPVEAAAEPEDDDLGKLPEKIKQRFQREKRLRETIIAEREQIRQAALQVATVAQRKDEEIVALRKQYATVQKQYADTLDYSYDLSIASKAAELRKAREDGNYDSELKLQSELDQLRYTQNQLKDAKRNLPDPELIKAPPPQQIPDLQPTPAQKKADVAPLAVKWIDNNKVWFNNPKFQGHRAFVLAEDSRLARDGYDKNSKEYYAELDRRIDEAFPTLRKRGKPVSNGGTRPPVAGVGATPRNSSKKTIKLTGSDFANMRRFGLDPRDKEHLRAYARSKRRPAAAAA